MNDDVNKTDEHQNDYEEICYICRRPESKAGKMMKLPNDITICSECMQKTFDAMNNSPFPMGGMDFAGFTPFMFGGEIPKSHRNSHKIISDLFRSRIDNSCGILYNPTV